MNGVCGIHAMLYVCGSGHMSMFPCDGMVCSTNDIKWSHGLMYRIRAGRYWEVSDGSVVGY